MELSKDYPCLHKMWIILCDDHGLPKDTPFPKLGQRREDEMAYAEVMAESVTMGQLGKWINGELPFAENTTLKAVLDDLWQEIDNV